MGNYIDNFIFVSILDLLKRWKELGYRLVPISVNFSQVQFRNPNLLRDLKHRIRGYEKYLIEKNAGRFRIYAFVPALLSAAAIRRIRESGVLVRVAIESEEMGIYKSIAYEIFKRRESALIALDGNSAGANLIQEAKNAKYKCHIYVSARSIDEVNVQVVTEKLGGGGHMSVAGVQFTDCDVEEAMDRVKAVLRKMIEGGEI